jgi:tRNA A37 threonylcarbamoyladenosine modification protein TsaB
MEILITIKDKIIRLSLLKEGKERDAADIREERSLSERLLPEIDNLLKKNKLTPEDIEKIEVKSDQNDNFTTTRIAKAVANAWNFDLADPGGLLAKCK